MIGWLIRGCYIMCAVQDSFVCIKYKGGGVLLDRSLITALVERWRRETLTFHLPMGEATITLQDVAVLLGLQVHWEPVTGHASQLWNHLVEELLGVAPDDDPETGKPVLRGLTLKLSWLRRHFIHLPAAQMMRRCRGLVGLTY
ncbi:Serine/threonine-protein phosphatase 7 long form-like protein [Bienertia sinuspersici]